MTTQVLGFRKTEHFMYRQWDRKISDEVIGKILTNVKCRHNQKEVTISFSGFLNRIGQICKQNDCFVLITKGNNIITCYWRNHPEYLYLKEKDANFQILN